MPLAIAVVASQVLVFCGFSPMTLGQYFAVAVGGVFLAAHNKRIDKNLVPLLVPVIYTVIRSLTEYIPGYTEWHIVALLGFVGLAIAAKNAKPAPLYWALVVITAINVTIALWQPQWWQTPARAAEYFQQNRIWGTAVHWIYFASLCYCGMIAAVLMRRWELAAIAAAAVFWAHSHTMIVVLCITLALILYKHAGARATAITLVALVVAVLFVYTDGGFALGAAREKWWRAIIEAATGARLWWGHGLGAWQITTLECAPLAHPHNEFLHVLHELGLVGLALWLVPWIYYTANSYGSNPILSCGFGLLVLSAATHSLRYTAIAVPLAVLCGRVMHESEKTSAV